MRNNIYWGLLFVAICAIFCGCVAEKPDPEDYDVDKIVAELVEHTKHHRKEPIADEPNQAKNKQKPVADEKVADFPIQDIFGKDHEYTDFELMNHVKMELWNRGVHGITGMSISHQTGLIHPTIKGIAFADWEPSLEIFGIGFGRRYTRISGHPDDFPKPGPPGPVGMKIKPGVKVFHISEGINPYLLLKIPKEK